MPAENGEGQSRKSWIIIAAVAGVGCFLVVPVIGLLAGLLVPNLLSARGEAQLARCKTNLRNIGFACEKYAEIYSVYPSGEGLEPFRQLVRSGFVDSPRFFVCPSTGAAPLQAGVQGQRIVDPEAFARALSEAHCSYAYTGKLLTTTHSDQLPLCRDRPGNHGGTHRVNVVFKSAYVDSLKEDGIELREIERQMGP